MKYSHLYDISFFVESEDKWGLDITAADFRSAVLDQIDGFSDRDWGELLKKPVLTVDENGRELEWGAPEDKS